MLAPVGEENANHCKPQCHKSFKASQMVELGADGLVSGDSERKTAPSSLSGLPQVSSGRKLKIYCLK